MTTSQTWRPKPRPRSRYYAQIDLLPFLAICVFFLFLFMISAPVPVHGKRVDLPFAKTATPQPGALREDVTNLMIARTGDLFLGPTKVAGSDLSGFLRSMMTGDAERRVYIKADARAKYGDVKRVLEGIRDAGISDVTFLVEQRRPEPPRF